MGDSLAAVVTERDEARQQIAALSDRIVHFEDEHAQLKAERDSSRDEATALRARVELLAEERERYRDRISALEADLTKAMKQIVDGMLVNAGQFAYFGVGPKLPDPPKVDFPPSMDRASEEARNRNRDFLANTKLQLQFGADRIQPEAKPAALNEEQVANEVLNGNDA